MLAKLVAYTYIYICIKIAFPFDLPHSKHIISHHHKRQHCPFCSSVTLYTYIQYIHILSPHAPFIHFKFLAT